MTTFHELKAENERLRKQLALTDEQTKFIDEIARMTKDGERVGDYGNLVMENDTAYDTLHSLISQARHLSNKRQLRDNKI